MHCRVARNVLAWIRWPACSTSLHAFVFVRRRFNDLALLLALRIRLNMPGATDRILSGIEPLGAGLTWKTKSDMAEPHRSITIEANIHIEP